MATAVQGKRIIYLFRRLVDAATKAGTVMAFTTENERTMSKDSDTTATKDGSINTPGTLEHELSATAILAAGDDTATTMEDALENGDLMEVWEVNLDEPGTDDNKFKGKYFQGYLTEWSLSSGAEDHAEYSTSFALNGAGKRGEVTVSEEQQEAAAYAFKDAVAAGA